jgi:CTP:molybdopterin cytidylyltransferase MocA
MDAVILAAGRGERLGGITPPYFKPLLVVNGKPLILQAVRLAHEAVDGVVTVMVAPENALPICQVLEHQPGLGGVRVVVQRTNLGPGATLRTALSLSEAPENLVLLADNVLTQRDVKEVAQYPAENVVGTTMIPAHDAERFTRREIHNKWVEKTPVSNTLDDAECWVGPIKVDTNEMESAIDRWMAQGHKTEVPIGPLFNDLTDVRTVNVSSIDIGVPEALK